MTPLPVERETVLVRLNGIEGELVELQNLSKIPFQEFADGVGFKLSQYHLHRALEGVFHIIAHILSRVPGGHEGGGYKDLARLFGEKGFIERSFAKKNLVSIAGYRNRLVHFYAEISPKEIFKLLHENLGDVETF